MFIKLTPKFRLIFLTFLVVAEIVVLAIMIQFADFSDENYPVLGVTFSKSYAINDLDLDWQETYLAILDDLKVKDIRLVAQWNEVEPEFKKFYFNDLDWMLDRADERDVNVIMAIGRRVPRWPECHDPAWIADLPVEKVEIEQLELIRVLVEHFQSHESIVMWQVENEPFLNSFGECPETSIGMLKKEVALVKSLDERPVMVTDSGELSTWLKTAHLGDKFGHTLYRVVYNEYIGYFNHVFAPSFYRFKSWMVRKSPDDMIVAELQAEPWVPYGYDLQVDVEKMNELMNPDVLLYNISFARKTGFSEIYLWGVEWWYWMKVNGDDSMWETAKEVIGEYNY